MLPSVLASGVTQFTIFINTGFALDLQKGSVTALTTAFRLWQLPVGLFGVATGMVVLPAVSRMMVGDGRKEVAVHIAKGLRLVAFFAVPAFLILFILGTEFVSSVYQWGRFNQDAVRYTGEVLGAYSLGLLGYAGTKVVQPVFLALEKRWVPLIAAAVALAISIGLNYYFVYGLHKKRGVAGADHLRGHHLQLPLLLPLPAPPSWAAWTDGRWFPAWAASWRREPCWGPYAGRVKRGSSRAFWTGPSRPGSWASPWSAAAPELFTWRRPSCSRRRNWTRYGPNS